MNFILLSHWSKHPQTSLTIVNAIGYPPQPGGKNLLLKIPLMPSNMGKSSWCPSRSFTPTD